MEKEPKDCLKCQWRGTSKCAFLNRSYNDKTRCMFVLNYSQPSITDLVTLYRPGDRLPSSYFPEWMFQTEKKEMDYNRNDSKEIVNSMRPFNN